MSILIIFFIGLCTILLSKLLFKVWFNHLAIYTFVWMGMLIFFELKLLNYFPLKNYTWYIIASGFLSFLFGVLVIYTARNSMKDQAKVVDDISETEIPLLSDKGKAIKYTLYLTGIIALFAALQNWYVLIQKFGSIPAVFLSANSIYRLRVEGKLGGVLPYLGFFSFIGICLAGVYTAYKGKLTLAAFLPILGSILKSLAQFGRIGMLIAVVQFLASFFIFKNYLDNRKVKKKLSWKLVVPVVLILLIVIGSSSLIKSFRGSYERYRGASHGLRTLTENPFFSPSVYLYLSSHVGVLNQYLIKDVEDTKFGETTFSPFYNISAKLGFNEPIPFDLRGYYIPMWTNSGTILRDFHSDFGMLGVYLGPFILGALCTFFWFQFYEKKKMIYFILLVYFFMVVTISFFSSVMKGADWYISLFIFFWLIPFLERQAIINKNIEREAVKVE